MRPRGFALLEFLLVLAALALLAGLTLPHYYDARATTLESTLVTDLEALRRAIEDYRADHDQLLPGTLEGETSEALLFRHLTAKSRSDGVSSPVGKCGPYLPVGLPRNPYNGFAAVKIVLSGEMPPPDDTTGWIYHAQTGEVRANCRLADPSGKPLYSY